MDGAGPRRRRHSPDWRSEGDYDFVEALAPEQLAWEFLRRNPEFRAATNGARGKTTSNPTAWGILKAGRCR